MTKPYMQYEPEQFEGAGIVARWRGGEYIEIGTLAPSDGRFIPTDVINVWDHEAGRPRTEFLSDPFEAMARAVDAHFAEREAEED